MERSIAISVLRAATIMEEGMRAAAHTKSGSITFHFKDGKMLRMVPALALSRSDLEALVDARSEPSFEGG